MFTKRHVAGIGVSMVVFGMFGLLVGTFVALFTGVTYGDPVSALATGPTPIPVADVVTPFGLVPEDVGLAADSALVLPGLPGSVQVLGVTLSASGVTLAQASGGGGMLLGLLVGAYYAVDIAWEQYREGRSGE